MSDYMNIWASVVKVCQEEIARLKAAGLSTDLQYFDFEGVAVNADLPNADLVGIQALGTINDADSMHIASISLGISTVGDQGVMFKQRRIIDAFYKLFETDSSFDLVDSETGAPIGFMKALTGTTAYPAERTSTRAFNLIEFRFGVGLGSA